MLSPITRRVIGGVVEKSNLKELVFLVEESPDGGYFAKALGVSVFTEADDIPSLKEKVRDAVRCHYSDPAELPGLIRLHHVRDEIFTV